jgi:transcriptional regulator with XRE-family HTH domain
MTLRDRRSFPGLLADLREQAGWSQSRLAAEAGIDASFLCLLEGGKRQPSRATIGALATTLDLDIDDMHGLYVTAGLLPPGRWVCIAGWCIRPDQEEAPA